MSKEDGLRELERVLFSIMNRNQYDVTWGKMKIPRKRFAQEVVSHRAISTLMENLSCSKTL